MSETEEPPNFKPSRSNLIEEIKGQLMNLNDALSKARTAQRFQANAKPSSGQVYAAAYEHFDRLFGLSRELLPKELVEKAGAWLDQPTPLASGNATFMDNLTTYKRGIDKELYKLGIKDTNLRKPVIFPMRSHEDRYAHLDDPEQTQ